MEDKKQFKRLSQKELRKLDIEELVAYKKRERANLLESDGTQTGHKLRHLVHPILLGALHIYHKIKKIRITINGVVAQTNRPIIFSVSHIGMYDVEVVLQAIRKHVYMLSADEEAMYRTFDGWFFDTNGVIYVDPEDKADKKVAIETAIKYLNKGKSLLWCPEGTWNLSPNYVILPIHYGIIEAAVQTNAVIIPIGVEQYDKTHGIDFIVNIGDAFDPNTYIDGELTREQKIMLAEMLRSDMARLKMDAWGTASRIDIGPGYWEEFIAKRLAEWPYYTMDIIHRREFNPKGFISPSEAFEHLNHLIPCRENAFLWNKRYYNAGKQ